MSHKITDDRKWRISKSGYSIKTGWGDSSRIVMAYHAPLESPLDAVRFQQWIDDAEKVCELYNATLERTP